MGRVYNTAHIRSKKRNIVRNLVTELVLRSRVSVTKGFLLLVKKKFDRVINFAKKDQLSKTREALKIIRNDQINSSNKSSPLLKLKEISKKYENRSSGFLRSEIIKVRRGDNAKIYRLSLV